MSHTYAIIPVSYETYEEIREKLIAAGYFDQIHDVPGSVFEVLDMYGIGIQVETNQDDEKTS